MTTLTREAIERRLLELSRAADPVQRSEYAMCYSTAPPPDHWVFVCPTCGKRTAYLPDQASVWSEVPPPSAAGDRLVSIGDVRALAIQTASALVAAKGLS